jgi:cbb3-type cytochrome oxidase subunit 3
MFKDVLNHMAGAADYASIGLVIFFAVFVAVSCRAVAQSRKEVADWARLPLADDCSSEVRHD